MTTTDAAAAAKRLLKRLIVVQEEERRWLAQNLHDDLGQRLTSLRLTLGTLAAGLEAQPPLARTADSALAILSTIDDAIDFLAWQLRPAALDEFGLAQVVEGFVAEWCRHSSIDAQFHCGLSASDRFAPEVEATVYRIAQEALNNVARRAQASCVNVLLEAFHDRIVLIVEDDGRGYAVRGDDRTMGSSGMVERAMAVGGTLEFEPTPQGGTTVLARIPIAARARLAPADENA